MKIVSFESVAKVNVKFLSSHRGSHGLLKLVIKYVYCSYIKKKQLKKKRYQVFLIQYLVITAISGQLLMKIIVSIDSIDYGATASF